MHPCPENKTEGFGIHSSMKQIFKGSYQTLLFFLFSSLLFPSALLGQTSFIDNEVLAGKISNSIHRKIDQRYSTLAISRVRLFDKKVQLDVNELIDYTNVKIVRGKRFRVTDRSKLKLLLNEQRIQLSEFVSPNDYKELGMLLGVQLFIYGSVYSDALILKAIDVQNSEIVWAETFSLYELQGNYELLNNLSGKLIESISKDTETFKKEKALMKGKTFIKGGALIKGKAVIKGETIIEDKAFIKGKPL